MYWGRSSFLVVLTCSYQRLSLFPPSLLYLQAKWLVCQQPVKQSVMHSPCCRQNASAGTGNSVVLRGLSIAGKRENSNGTESTNGLSISFKHPVTKIQWQTDRTLWLALIQGQSLAAPTRYKTPRGVKCKMWPRASFVHKFWTESAIGVIVFRVRLGLKVKGCETQDGNFQRKMIVLAISCCTAPTSGIFWAIWDKLLCMFFFLNTIVALEIGIWTKSNTHYPQLG